MNIASTGASIIDLRAYVDPSVVPGVLFANRPVQTENPRLLDIGPTVLDLFGVPVPEYMDGKALIVEDGPGDLKDRSLGEAKVDSQVA